MDVVTLKLSPRSVTGKKVKRLRKEGAVPVHVYGRGIESQALQTEAHVLRRVLPQVGTNIPLSLELDGETGENICFVREVQRHPVTEEVLHVDFLRVDVSRAIQAEVPITLTGAAPAVRELGGTLLQPLLSLLVEALPMNVPASIEVDVSELDDFEKGVYVRDIALASTVTLITDPDDLAARVAPPRIEVEEEVVGEEEEFELEEGEEPLEEGEEAATEADQETER